jgi:hypothetical protein
MGPLAVTHSVKFGTILPPEKPLFQTQSWPTFANSVFRGTKMRRIYYRRPKNGVKPLVGLNMAGAKMNPQ